jgi:dTDP-4-amino-4,6-dideoxy-D-galactose acyltransferase
MNAALFEYLDWDSNFFGFRIARLTSQILTPELVGACRSWCAANHIECLYFLSVSNDVSTASLAHANGFELVDIRVTLKHSLRDYIACPAPAIRPFCSSDAPRLREIARVSHGDSRFYYDPRFPRSRCDAFYETWIERSFSGWADIVLVAVLDGAAEGYITCHLAPSGDGSIGLVAVSRESQGKGLGKQLVIAALEYFCRHNRKLVTVVTQGRNITSQRVYQRCGFLTQAVQLWYHFWLRTGSSQ